MPLKKQLIPLTFSQGVGTKADPKAKVPLKLGLLSNAVMRKVNRLEKRPGCKPLGSGVVGSTEQLEDGDALAVFNGELLQFNKQRVFSYSEQADRWVQKGACVSAITSLRDVLKNNYQQTQVDMAVTNDIALVAWEDSRGGCRCSVIDLESDTALLVDTQLNASATRPRCVAFDGSLYVFYVVSATLYARKVNPINPYPLASEQTISTAINSSAPNYDVIPQDEYICAAYNVQGATQIRLHKLSADLSVLQTANIAEAATNCLGVVRGANSRLFLAWHNASGLRGVIFDVFLSPVLSVVTIDTLTALTAVAVTGYAMPDGSGVRFFYQVSAAATYNTYVRQNSVSTAGTPGTSAVFLRSVGLASKAFAHSPNTTDYGFVGLVHESTLQSTFFVARSDGLVCAKFAYGMAGGLLSRSLPGTVSIRNSGAYVFPALTKNPIVAAGDTEFLTFKGVSAAEIDFTDIRAFSSAQEGDNCHILGGILATYDGQSVVEHGFHLYPENITAAQGTGGSLTLLGTYSYVVVYEWTDNHGKIHRSAPSAPIAVTMTSSNNRVTLTVPTLRLTEKRGSRTPLNIVVYRTETLGSLYYRASSPTTLTYNDTTADTVTIVDDLADSTLISRELLYSTGGLLENMGAPSASLITNFKQRVSLGGTDDDTIFFSKEAQQGKPVEFAFENSIKAATLGGRNTCIANLDDKFIIFKRDSIYVVTGDGPNDAGIGVFSPPERVSSDVGCIDAKSVVVSPDGIMFKSAKGYYLLGSDLAVSYIGADVEDWNSYTCSAACLMADTNEVIFTTNDGPALVYNYFFKQWSTFDFSADDAVIWNGRLVCVRKFNGRSSQVVIETPGEYLDCGSPFSMKLVIDWLSFAGLQALQRVYRILFLGEFKSKHLLKISVGYDFSPVWAEEYYWNPADAVNTSFYGDDPLYGDDVYGGADAPYVVKIGVSRQKCTAIKLQLEDINQEGTGESMTLTGMAAVVGVKRGAFRTAAEAQI